MSIFSTLGKLAKFGKSAYDTINSIKLGNYTNAFTQTPVDNSNTVLEYDAYCKALGLDPNNPLSRQQHDLYKLSKTGAIQTPTLEELKKVEDQQQAENAASTGTVPSARKGTSINIKKKNKGKFTDYCGGKVTNECINKAKKSGNKKLIKRAVFAENARKWKKHEK